MSAAMKTFSGCKPFKQIKAQCKATSVALDDYNHRVSHADYVAIGIASGKRPDGTPLVYVGPGHDSYVMYNTFNGRFYGRTDKGVDFDSDSAKHENKPWFQALLSFFYWEKEAPLPFRCRCGLLPIKDIERSRRVVGVVRAKEV